MTPPRETADGPADRDVPSPGGAEPDGADPGTGKERYETWAVAVPPGYRVGCYRVTHGLRSGSWGSVYAARRVTAPARDAGDDGPPATVALKFLPTGTLTPRRLAHLADMARREADRHANLQHPYLVRTYEVLTVDDPGHPGLDGATVVVMDLAAGSLATPPGQGGTASDPVTSLREVAEALEYLHGTGWVHGDLTPSNVLVMPDGRCCLTDFGASGELEGTHAYLPPVGTAEYVAPERWAAPATVQGLVVRPSADVWAFGVLAHHVLAGRSPFPGDRPSERVEAAARYAGGGPGPYLDPSIGPGMRRLIAECLAVDPQDRPTAADVARRTAAGDAPAAAPPAEGGVGSKRRRHARERAREWVWSHRLVTVAVAVVAFAAGAGGVQAVRSAREAPTADPGQRVAVPVLPSQGCRSTPQRVPDITGHVWEQTWYCRNAPASPVYAEPDAGVQVGWLDTSTSWFLCYQAGQRHSGGNDIWYFTQGDRSIPEHYRRHAWGFVPAAVVHTARDPAPGVPRCPFEKIVIGTGG